MAKGSLIQIGRFGSMARGFSERLRCMKSVATLTLAIQRPA
jgi:hypothetical protein